jgi:hypothetical protein
MGDEEGEAVVEVPGTGGQWRRICLSLLLAVRRMRLHHLLLRAFSTLCSLLIIPIPCSGWQARLLIRRSVPLAHHHGSATLANSLEPLVATG